MRFPEVLKNRLSSLDPSASRRALFQRKGVDFSSNDYLSFSQDPQLRDRIQSLVKETPVGASASRLLRGQLPLFESAESIFARFSDQEAALFFATGYQANLGLLSSLLKPGDLVFSDQYNHASLIDGMRLSGAKKRVYPHHDCVALRDLLKETAHLDGFKVIVTESIFGMDGDIAPLAELADLAEEFSAVLIVDEAHASGLWGNFERNQGAGIVQHLGLSHRVFATIHPGGKSFGVGGAWIAGSAELKEYLVNFSRPFIFSTAPMPMLAMALQAAVDYWGEVGKARAQSVLKSSNQLRESLRALLKGDERIPECSGAITPVILGENRKALEKAKKLQLAGLDIRAIRPPTVPENTARLRITTQWNHSESDFKKLIEAF